MAELVDDAAGFAAVERDFVRRFVPDFEWLHFDAPSPRTPPRVSLEQARVGLVSTAGAHLAADPPIGSDGEVRIIPLDADVSLAHVGYDTRRAEEDLDVVYPARLLAELARHGPIGSVAPSVISTMGFVPDGGQVLERSVPMAIEPLRNEGVDLALLVPA